MEASQPPGSGGGPLGGLSDNLQKAIDDLRGAGEKATGDVRTQIDSAVSRLRDATNDATSRATDASTDWRATLDSATEDVRLQLGKLAIRAQTSKKSLKELKNEIDERKKEIKKAG